MPASTGSDPRPGFHRAALRLMVALVLLVVAALATTTRSDAGDAATDLDIAAEHLHLDHQRRDAVFTGDVRIRHGEWLLRSPRVVVRYDEAGQISEAVADGPVELAGQDFLGRARSATYAPATATVTLHEDVEITRGRSVVRAQQAVVEVKTHRLELLQVRGRLFLDDVAPLADPAGEAP